MTATDASILSQEIYGLMPATTYYYRVTAGNSAGRSGVSNTIFQITVPGNPITIDVTDDDVSASTFFAKWNEVSGADEYEFEVSQDDFSSFLPGYTPFLLAGTGVQVTGLLPETTYKFRVRAKNSAGTSANSNVITVTTFSDNIGVALTLDDPIFNATQESGSTQTIRFGVNGGVAPYMVNLKYRQLLSGDFNETQLSYDDDGISTFDVLPEYLDDLGFEFEIVVTDATGTSKTQTGQIYLAFSATSSPPVPFSRFGGTVESWNLFTIPFELDNSAISNIFAGLDPVRHEFDWRIMRYRNSSNDYVNFNAGQARVGEAYWFNSKENVTTNTGAGQVTTEIPFVMNLSQGWNLIGNPCSITISWNQVLSDNGDPADVGQLQVFSGTTQSTGNVMAPFTGGFVFAENATSVSIDPRTVAGGRRLLRPVEKIRNHQLDQPEWILHLNLEVNGTPEQIGGVGMHPEALPLKDEYYRMAVPRFVVYSDLYSFHEEYFYPWFATDIVPTDQAHSWSFDLASNKTEGMSTITWDNEALGDNDAQLILLDKLTGQIINMKKTGSYSVDLDGKEFEFEIFYSADPDTPLSPQQAILGNAYPNPAKTSTFIPLAVPAFDVDVTVRLTLLDINGKRIKTLVNQPLQPGFHQVEWDLTDDGSSAVSRGMYIYRVEIDGHVLQKKLIVE